MDTKNQSLVEITKSAVAELELIALAVREVSKLRRVSLSLNDLILYNARSFMHMPYFLQGIFSKIRRHENLKPEQLLDLNNCVIESFDSTTEMLSTLPFTPRHKVAFVAGALTSQICFSVSEFATLCAVSQDTANRWLDAATRARVLRKLKHGNTQYFINLLHYRTLENLCFHPGETKISLSYANERLPGAIIQSLFPPYPESTPPF